MAVTRKLKTYLPFAHLQQVATSSTSLYSPPSVYSPKFCSFVCLCKNCKLPSKLFTNILYTWEILLTHTSVVSACYIMFTSLQPFIFTHFSKLFFTPLKCKNIENKELNYKPYN